MGEFSRVQERILNLSRLDGRARFGETVRVRQSKHAFLFGCTAFELAPLANDELNGREKEDAERHERNLHEVFNYFTLPFYWGRFEPVEGQPDTRRTLKNAQRLVEKGAIVKGHPLCWHTVCADWLMNYSNQEIHDKQMGRIRREVDEFKSVIDRWDVVNEAVIMPVFDKYDNAVTRICWEKGRVAIIRDTFAAARETNPCATLVLNDFDMSTAYECLIEAVLEAGIKIDVLGLQSHMHQGWWGVQKTQDVLRRFSRYGVPLHFTETTLVSGELMPESIVDLNDWQADEWPSTPEGEERQAEELERQYTMLFNHPSVHAVTWWGASDGGWLKAPSGLMHADGSIKPAYERLHRLVKQDWWLAETELPVGPDSTVHFMGAPGTYEIERGDEWLSFNVKDP